MSPTGYFKSLEVRASNREAGLAFEGEIGL